MTGGGGGEWGDGGLGGGGGEGELRKGGGEEREGDDGVDAINPECSFQRKLKKGSKGECCVCVPDCWGRSYLSSFFLPGKGNVESKAPMVSGVEKRFTKRGGGAPLEFKEREGGGGGGNPPVVRVLGESRCLYRLKNGMGKPRIRKTKKGKRKRERSVAEKGEKSPAGSEKNKRQRGLRSTQLTPTSERKLKKKDKADPVENKKIGRSEVFTQKKTQADRQRTREKKGETLRPQKRRDGKKEGGTH